MKRLYKLLFLLSPVFGMAQGKGVRFERNLPWKDVLAKAKKTRKYIFVECYATWCGPCKQMERNVFTQKEVGDSINERFISIRVQMDTSAQDNEEVKSWYADAHELMKKYKITVFPSFVFLSKDGAIVHKAIGYKDPEHLISLASDASNPNRQYYTLLKNYTDKRADPSSLVYLAKTAKLLSDKDIAEEVAKVYKVRYLLRLKGNEFYTKENIQFIVDFTKNSSDGSFSRIYGHEAYVDSVMDVKDYAGKFIDYIITKEEVDTILWPFGKPVDNEPGWAEITNDIFTKYNTEYADRVTIESKVRWYALKKDLPKYTQNLVSLVGKYGLNMNGWELNNMAWQIFLFSVDSSELRTALQWSERSMEEQKNASQIGVSTDTYANILYKLGRRNEAITWEERAIKLDPGYNDAQKALKKMKSGEPTWPIN